MYIKKKPSRTFIFNGFKELKAIWTQLKDQHELKIFLRAFFVFSIGVQTVILLASVFVAKDIELPDEESIIIILIMQLIAIIGAYLFSRISERIGNIKALKITIVIWSIVCLGAYFLHKEDPKITTKLYMLAASLGLVFGAIQTLSRSTYSKLLPENTESHATYFSFYDVTEKLSIVLGMAMSGIIASYTSSLRLFFLLLSVFFVLGFIILGFIKKTKYVQ